MKLHRKVVAIMILTTTLIIVETHQASAQDAPPDLNMLMNLDLFASRSKARNDAPGTGTPGIADAAAPGADDSMFAQIRALSAMGYLGDNADSARAAAPGNANGDVAPSSLPTKGVEDQQR